MITYKQLRLGLFTILCTIFINEAALAKTDENKENTDNVEEVTPFPPETELEKRQKAGLEKGPKQVLTPGQVALQLATQEEAPDVVCVRNSGLLRVAILDKENPPFYFTNKKGNPEGIDVNLAKELAAGLGARVEFVKVPNAQELIDTVAQRKANLGLGHIPVSNKNASKVRLTDAYVNMERGLLINRLALKKLNQSGGESLNDILALPGSTIGVLENSPYESYAKEVFPKTEIKTYKTQEELQDAVLNGDVLATFQDELTIRKILDQNPRLGIYLQAIYLKGQNDPIQAMVAWNSNQLAHLINVFLESHSAFVYDAPGVVEQEKKYQNEIQ